MGCCPEHDKSKLQRFQQMPPGLVLEEGVDPKTLTIVRASRDMTLSPTVTACECARKGPVRLEEGKQVFWCERHQVWKTAHHYDLCRTKAGYFEAWEEGSGPGQNPPLADQDESATPKPPPLHRRAWNLVASLAAFVADGLKTVDKDAYQRRLEVCDGCDQRRDSRCMKCGCYLTLKARGRAFKCPLGKWPEA